MKYQQLSVLALLISVLSISSCTKELTSFDIQEKLDNGQTPSEIFTETGWRDFYAYHYNGGIIIKYSLLENTGYIASKENLGHFPWGCYGSEIIIDSNVLEEINQIGVGSELTEAILAQECDSGSAAEACNNYIYEGYDDWFLPSYSLLETIDWDAYGFKGEYWSSNFNGTEKAMTVYVRSDKSCREYTGWFGGTYKDCNQDRDRNDIKLVRAVRRF
jgi:hypothetical protein